MWLWMTGGNPVSRPLLGKQKPPPGGGSKRPGPAPELVRGRLRLAMLVELIAQRDTTHVGVGRAPREENGEGREHGIGCEVRLSRQVVEEIFAAQQPMSRQH